MTTNIDRATGDMASEFSALREDLGRLTATLGELMRLQTQAAGASVSGAIGSAQAKIADTAADATIRARAAGSEIEACIERNPMTALLVVFGIGISFGMISRFRR